MKNINKNLETTVYILLFILIIFLSFTRLCNANDVSQSPIEDSGQVEATILDIYHPANPQIDYGKIKIDKVLEYSHDQRANYDALKVGDIIPIFFQWGAQKTTVNDINLSGVKIGDKISVIITGCPGCGNGWTLYEYSVISKMAEPTQPVEPTKSGVASISLMSTIILVCIFIIITVYFIKNKVKK